jgi:hypothetical protein
MNDMTLHRSRSCADCVDRFIGPALVDRDPIGHYTKCYGCGNLRTVYGFTYWFPWPTDTDEQSS